jgi:molecular chaperone HscB
MNYFELFGIEPSFTIDTATIKKKFYELSRANHPDFFGGGTEEEQNTALEQSATINEAYKTLQNKDQLIKYILGLKGLIQEEEKVPITPRFFDGSDGLKRASDGTRQSRHRSRSSH